MEKTAILIPTLRRHNNIARVVADIGQHTDGDYEIYFIVEDNDIPTRLAIERENCIAIINERRPCYAGAINTAYHKTVEPYIFLGADDLHFHHGWLSKALFCMRLPDIGVVGTNDLGHPDVLAGTHATHYLVKRSYIEEQSGVVDQPDTVLHEYIHNYTDTEFIETAKMRQAFSPCLDSIVEHLHWSFGKNPMDETYKKGFDTDAQDRFTYTQRQHLWMK